MRVQATIQKWGNGLGIRISGTMRDIPHFEAGMPVEVDVSEKGLKIRKATVLRRRRLFSEAELLKNMTPKTAHAELIANVLKGEY